MGNNNVEYLEEQNKQQSAPAVPQAAPTTVQAVDGYGKFLETLANNKRIENTPTNAKTYADYLTYIGQDPIGDYNAKVRQANLDYAKGLATYGQAAEKMAKSGMTGSGYGEYLQGIAYQGKQSAVGAAQQAAQAAMKQTFSSYGEYLEGVKGTNEQNAINGIVSGLLEGDAAKAYARQQGVTEDRLEQVLAQTSGTVSAAKQQKLAEATSAVTQLMANNKSVDYALASLKGVYDQTVLDQVKDNLQKANAQQAGATINTATGVTDFKAELDKLLGSKAISLTDYDMQVEEGSAKNMEFINKALEGDISGLSAYIDTLAVKDKDGNVKKGKSGAEMWAKMDDDDKTKQIEEWVDQLYKSGDLTPEHYQSFYHSDLEASLREDTDNPKELVSLLENAGTRLANGQISQKQYNMFLAAYSAKASEVGGAVFVDDESFYSGNTVNSVIVKYKQGEYGKEDIQIDLGATPLSSGSGFVAGKTIVLNNQNGEGSKELVIGTINGTVAYMFDGKYYQPKKNTNGYANTKQNAAFIAYMMVP